jgi:hypothetical protein
MTMLVEDFTVTEKQKFWGKAAVTLATEQVPVIAPLTMGHTVGAVMLGPVAPIW